MTLALIIAGGLVVSVVLGILAGRFCALSGPPLRKCDRCGRRAVAGDPIERDPTGSLIDMRRGRR